MPESTKPKARDLNQQIRYTMWSVFKVARPLGVTLDEPARRAAIAAEVEALEARLASSDVIVRGWYDVAGLRADADFLVWWHAESPDALQDAYAQLRHTSLGQASDPVWSVMALHRPDRKSVV